MSEKTVLEFKAKAIVSVEKGHGQYSLILFQPERETRDLIHDCTGKRIDYKITDDAGTFFPEGQQRIVNASYFGATDTMVVQMKLVA